MGRMLKIAGIYMIRNKLNGKVYIGESKDIYNRWKKYRWAAQTDKTYHEASRTIALAMKQDGVDNFEFTILRYGKKYEDRRTRAAKEIELIAKYQSNDPQYGYNESSGGELGAYTPRKQGQAERYKRSVSIIVYDTKKDHYLLYLSGAKGFAKELGYERTIITRNIKRGSLIADRYYAFYTDSERRHEIINKLKARKMDAAPVSDDLRAIHAREMSKKAYQSYMAIANQMDIVAESYGL